MSVRDFAIDVFAVAWSEFRQLGRNRTAMLISLVVLPSFFIFALGAMGGSFGGGARTSGAAAAVRIAFVDNDGSMASAQLFDALSKSGDFDNLVEGYTEDSTISALAKGDIYAAIVVPKGFKEELFEHRQGSIIVYVNDSEPGLSDAVLSSLRKYVRILSSTEAEVKVISKGRILSSFDTGLPIVLGVVQIFATFYEIAGGMSRSREEGIYPRLLLTRTSLWALIFGKTLYVSSLGVIRTFLVVGVAVYGWGAHPSTGIETILLLSLLVALVTMGFAFFVSAFRISSRAVVILDLFLFMLIIAFSGLSVEGEMMFGLSKAISTILPWSYGFDALRRAVLIGEPLASISFDLEVAVATITLFYVSAYAFLSLARERLIR